MQHIVLADLNTLEQNGTTEWLIGRPDSGNSCAVRVVRPINARNVGDLQSCRADRLLFILSGSLAIQIGTDSFVAEKHTLVLIPADVPHAERTGNSDATTFLEIFTPGPSPEFVKPVQPRKIDGAGSLVRPLLSENFIQGGFAYQSLAERKSGSDHVRVNIVEVQPGSGSPDWHIHAFDQFYFILAGQMQVEIGKKIYQAPANSLVHLPAGIVHRNYNLGPDIESHITLLVPEPAQGEILDYAIDIHEREAEIMSSAPGYVRKA